MLGKGLHLQTKQLQPSITFQSGCLCGKYSFIGSCVTPRNHEGSSWKMQAGSPTRVVPSAKNVASQFLRKPPCIVGASTSQMPGENQCCLARGRFTAAYCNFAYSALASFRMGMSGSPSFQRVRKSL